MFSLPFDVKIGLLSLWSITNEYLLFTIRDMAAEKRSEGLMKPIIVGVTTTVLTSVILFYLGLDKEGAKHSAENYRTLGDPPESTENLSEKDIAALERRQQELTDLLEAAEKRISDYTHQQGTSPVRRLETNSDLKNISGIWYDRQSGATYTIEQNGQFFTFQEVSVVGITASGEGTLKGKTGEFSYSTIMGTTGYGTFEVSAPENGITWSFRDNYSQMSGVLHLVRN